MIAGESGFSDREIGLMLEENRKRFDRLHAEYDPLTGEGAPLKREKLVISDHVLPVQFIPESMTNSELVQKLADCGSIRRFISKHTDYTYCDESYDEVVRQFSILRNKHDFPYWAYTIVRIKPKEGGEPIPFKLNYPQILLLEDFEESRLASSPVRCIICKARQWGGSTLVQIYMGWIQTCHKRAWYSTIVAQTKTTSNRILSMYEKMIKDYPSWAMDLGYETSLQLAKYGKGGINDYTIKDSSGNPVNDTVIQIGSVVEPDNIRGGDVALIHYSEVGVWKDTPGRRPEDLIRSLSGGLLRRPYTMEVLESTPKGTGNYFHREYLRAKMGYSNRKPFFIPWYYILHDTVPLSDNELVAMAKWVLHCRRLGDNEPESYPDPGKYYYWLWEIGATLQGIEWYRIERKGVDSHADMASEAPSDDIEAFESSGTAVFDKYKLNELRKTANSNYKTGEVKSRSGNVKGRECLDGLKFAEEKGESAHLGFLKAWSLPEPDFAVSDRYLVVVDIGGRWKKADYSVITVFDRLMMSMGGKPEIAAEWRGHIDHDLLAWKAAQIAKFYCDALLVVESNTLETKDKSRDTDGNDIEYVLDILSECNVNLYARESPSENIDMQKKYTKWGFHVNTNTKPTIINHMQACLRDLAWIERSSIACDEMGYYEKKDDHKYGAAEGQHDDMVMTRAIGLWICFRKMELPKPVERKPRRKGIRSYNESKI